MKVIFTLSILLLLAFTSSIGQEIDWQKTIGGVANDRLHKIRLTTDNGFIMGGTSSSNISGEKTEDFAFQPTGTVNDLHVSVTAINAFRPGFRGKYSIHYKNFGTTTLTPSFIFHPDTAAAFDSSSVIPDIISPDSVAWNLQSLSPFEEGTILVWVNISSALVFGDTISSFASVEPDSGDSFPSDNIDTLYTRITGSFDPNDILVDRVNIFTTELSTIYLEYTIRFQNTGNDTAFTVKINNPVSDKVDPASFVFLESSHPVNVNYISQDNTFRFQFDNLLLPDSNINEAGSHGFLKYRIKPEATLLAGELITSKAYIYFDFNWVQGVL